MTTTPMGFLGTALCRVIADELTERLPDQTVITVCKKLLIELEKMHVERDWKFDIESPPSV